MRKATAALLERTMVDNNLVRGGVLALALGLIITGYAQAEKPPLKFERITGEILAGGAGGLAAGFAGCIIVPMFFMVTDPDSFDDDQSELVMAGLAWHGFHIGVNAGYPFGTAIGVYLAGDTENETGSFLATLAGSLLGRAAGAGISRIITREYYNIDKLVRFLTPPIGAIIAFNLTRKYKSSANSDSQDARAAPAFCLDLLRMRF